jgi:hypothetical protein
MLQQAAMTVADMAKIAPYLTRAEDIGKVRSCFLARTKPGFLCSLSLNSFGPNFW